MRVMYRINRAFLAAACLLLAAGAVAAAGIGSWEAPTVMRVGRLTGFWLATTLVLCALPLLTWATAGVVGIFRRFGLAPGLLSAAALLIVAGNLVFWGLVAMGLPVAQERYQDGRLLWVGRTAMIFGHGYWRLADGYWQHQTVVRLEDGTLYRGSTLELLTRLRTDGAHSIWGSWCYSGNFPYIRKDLVTGEETPWPSYTSYNHTPGKTIPIWLGVRFVRLGWPQPRYDTAPEVIAYVPVDTLYMARPSFVGIEKALGRMQQRVRGLPRPDSISWQPVRPDTVYSLPWPIYRALDPAERSALRMEERAQVALKARVGIAQYWVRGRSFPVPVKVPARVYRPPEAPALAQQGSAEALSVRISRILRGTSGQSSTLTEPATGIAALDPPSAAESADAD